jgi:hypothetical protein
LCKHQISGRWQIPAHGCGKDATQSARLQDALLSAQRLEQQISLKLRAF